MKIHGRVLVILLALIFFATGCVYADVVEKEEEKLSPVAAVDTTIKKPKLVAKTITKEVTVFRNKELKRFIIGHYPIDVSEMRGKTRDDFNRMVQEFNLLGPDHRMVIIGSASFEASNLYNYDLGWERAEKVRQALLKVFTNAKIDIATKGERPDRRQVEVYYGASCADIPVRYLKKTESRLIICDSVTFEITSQIVTMVINLAQNDFKLKPGEIVRMHSRSRNNEFGHEGDVIAIGRFTDDGRMIFQFPNMIASSSDKFYIDRYWFDTDQDRWIVPCSRYLEPDSNNNLAIQVIITSDSVRPITADQFLDQAVRSDDQPSRVYFEKKDEYYEKEN